MKAVVTLPDKTQVDVDTTFDEIMRLACQPGHSIFLPACTCESAHTCRQHPRFKRRAD